MQYSFRTLCDNAGHDGVGLIRKRRTGGRCCRARNGVLLASAAVFSSLLWSACAGNAPGKHWSEVQTVVAVDAVDAPLLNESRADQGMGDGNVAFIEIEVAGGEQSDTAELEEVTGPLDVGAEYTCAPACEEKQCGSDGCGGSCGECDDGDVCNGEETCAQGLCVPGESAQCNDGNPCTLDECDALAGCQHAEHLGPCDDGNPCTEGGTCVTGICTGGNKIVCNDGNPCTADACSSVGGCVHVPNTLPCDDADPCTGGDQCAEGICESGKNVCFPCQSDLDCLEHDDGNLCNGIVACLEGLCQAVSDSQVVCAEPPTPCITVACDPLTGICVENVVTGTVYCDDGQLCTIDDLCKAGVCSGKPVNCEEGNKCTIDWCAPDDGCVHAPIECPYEKCHTSYCLPYVGECTYQPIACPEDDDACTVATCDPDVDVCTFVPLKCDDDNPCTDDFCDPASGCMHAVSNSGDCGAGQVCYLGECADGKALRHLLSGGCVVSHDGSVWCWGCKGATEPCEGPYEGKPFAVQVEGIVGAKAISHTAIRLHGCAILEGDTVWCWSPAGPVDGTDDGKAFAVQMKDLNGAKAVSGASYAGCAILEGGTIWCWGYNHYGQLGDGTTEDKSLPVQVMGLDGAVALARGYEHTCAIREDGTVWCWGSNEEGQIGIGTLGGIYLVPTLVSGITGATSLGLDWYHSCASRADGSVWCWGDNYDGQLGFQTWKMPVSAPNQVPGISGVVAVWTAFHHSCGLKADGTVWCWGLNDRGQVGPGLGHQHLPPTEIPDLAGVVAGAGRSDTNCILTAWGSVECWGENGYGYAGTGVAGCSSSLPRRVLGLDVGTAISAGNNHTCATDTTGHVWCWGSGGLVMGDGSKSSSCVPVMALGLSDQTTVASGDDHTCSLGADGTVACWGYNVFGAVGTPLCEDSTHEPAILDSPSGVVALGLGDSETYALVGGGNVWHWGSCIFGFPGEGCMNSLCSTPHETKHTGYALVAAGGAMPYGGTDFTSYSHFVCLVDTDGVVSCLNTGNTFWTLKEWQGSNKPKQVGLSGAAGVTAGEHHACAFLDDGTAWCWGLNIYGLLGIGVSGYSNVPVLVDLPTGVVHMDAGELHTCAALEDGSAWCWGRNDWGQLGNGTQEESLLDPSPPTQVVGLNDVVAVTAGKKHSCAFEADGSAWCWGHNEEGQLGDGSAWKTKPEKVVGLPEP